MAHPIAPRGTMEWQRCWHFLGLHASCLLVYWVGWSWAALATAAALYAIRMFFVTGFYHRYFSHRTFKTSRPFQFAMACAAGTAAQRGPLWWAAHHRHHHRHSDQEADLHSPRQKGFLWSHLFWFMTREADEAPARYVRDLAKYPELRWLDRNDWVPPVGLAALLFTAGTALEALAPQLGTNGLQILVWGFCVSTVALYHATYTINSLAHTLGTRRFSTRDDSRNNWILALLTLGEGWHNNHHFYSTSTRQGFYWWEIDLTFYGLKALELTGLIWSLRPVPAEVLEHGRSSSARRGEP